MGDEYEILLFILWAEHNLTFKWLQLDCWDYGFGYSCLPNPLDICVFFPSLISLIMNEKKI